MAKKTNEGTTMRKSSIRRQNYFRMEEKLAQKLDRKLSRTGYRSRSEFFTAVAYAAIYGVEMEKEDQRTGTVPNLPENVSTWLKKTIPQTSEEEIQRHLQAIIADLLIPIIAMKGIDIAFETTWKDIRLVCHEQTGIWITESDAREAYQSFASIHKTELEQYRQNQLENPDE